MSSHLHTLPWVELQQPHFNTNSEKILSIQRENSWEFQQEGRSVHDTSFHELKQAGPLDAWLPVHGGEGDNCHSAAINCQFNYLLTSLQTVTHLIFPPRKHLVAASPLRPNYFVTNYVGSVSFFHKMGPSALADQLAFFNVQIWWIYRVSPKPLAIRAKCIIARRMWIE